MILTTLEALRGDMARVSNKLDHISEAAQQAKIEASEHYIKNLDSSFGSASGEGGGHGN